MSYTALYRKFRPAEFEDVKGQDHIVTTLKNQIRSGRIGHALYLLRDAGNRKDDGGENFCQGGQLRASGGRQSMRRM